MKPRLVFTLWVIMAVMSFSVIAGAEPVIPSGDYFRMTMDDVNGSGYPIDTIGGFNAMRFINSRPQQVAGKVGLAMEFDGNNSWSFAEGTNVDLNGSISIWFKPAYTMNSTTIPAVWGQTAIWTYGMGGGTYNVLRIYRDGTHTPGCLSLKIHNLGYTDTPAPYTEWQADTWYHAVATWEFNGTNTSTQLYVNGVEVVSGLFDWDTPVTDRFWYLGGYSTENSRFWNGSLDDWIWFDRNLTGPEVRDFFGSYFSDTHTAPSSPPAGSVSVSVETWFDDSGAGTVKVNHTTTGGPPYNETDMTYVGGLWSASIGPFSGGDAVSYYFVADADGGGPNPPVTIKGAADFSFSITGAAAAAPGFEPGLFAIIFAALIAGFLFQKPR